MAEAEPAVSWAIHPVQAALSASFMPLFIGALLSDLAYDGSYELQWSHFAAWLTAGAMVFAGLALLWALIDLIRKDRKSGSVLLYFLLLLAVFLLGLINSFVHARDAWATMPDGLILSAVLAVLSIAANWIGFSTLRSTRAVR